MKATVLAVGFPLLLLSAPQALAWGDDGHETVALIAQQCLTPEAKREVTAMLAADTDNLTRHDIASAATWADRFRDVNHRQDNYTHTQNWHFVDMEITNPDLNSACFGRPQLPPREPATGGPDQVCAVDKIAQFAGELAAADTDPEERIMALKFVLHFVGDLHQPMHSSDNHDRGGNSVKVIVDGFAHKPKDELHGFWDTQFVDAIATPPSALAKKLLAQISPDQAKQWVKPPARAMDPDEQLLSMIEQWQSEAFDVAKTIAYGDPPLSKNTTQHLDSTYADNAKKAIAIQLSKGGIRLAYILNRTLGSEPSDWDTCLAH
jgi:hypothetical protein